MDNELTCVQTIDVSKVVLSKTELMALELTKCLILKGWYPDDAISTGYEKAVSLLHLCREENAKT